jgi:non-heme chloroperoxidase
VLIDTGFSTSNPVTQDLQTSLRDLPDPIPQQFARDFQAGTVYQPLPADFFERIIAESLKLPPRLWRLTIDQMLAYDDTRQLARIQAPTLLLWGDRDALFSRADQSDEGCADRCAADHLRRDWSLPELGTPGTRRC